MNKLEKDARLMMKRFPSGWSMKVSDLHFYFPNTNHALKVFRKMVELA